MFRNSSLQTTDNYGFSLLEISIVLAVVGMLSGGVLAGQSLIKAAELRTVMTELREYQTAINIFKEKYFALPGDMSNATEFWGKLNSTCTTHAGTANADGVCNGNGNGTIDWVNYAPFVEH